MKRQLTIILAICLILSVSVLSGCGGGGGASGGSSAAGSSAAQAPAAEETDAGGSGAAAGNEIQAMLDAGEDVLVGFALSTIADEMTQAQATQMQEKFKADGVNLQYISSDDDLALQITQIENFIEMGAKEIIISSKEPSALKEVCEKAMDQGIYVVFSGEANLDRIGFTPSGANAMDGTAAGEQLAKMALKWVAETYPDAEEGSIHVGVMAIDGVSMSAEMDAAYDAAFAGTPCQVTYRSPLCITADDGYNAAEEALTFDPEIRIFMGFTADDAIGASNYFEANKADYDMSQFAAFCTGVSGSGTDMIDKSVNNESILRGLCVIGEATDSTKDLWIVCHDLLFGLAEPPYLRNNELSTYNTVGYEME